MPAQQRRILWILVGVLAAVAAAGLGIAVHAQRDPTPAVQPYDPMPRW